MRPIPILVVMLLLVTTPAWAQVGIVNPNQPVTITVPPPPGSPAGTPSTTRPSVPFTSEPNQLNNPFPTLLNAGVSGTGGGAGPGRRTCTSRHAPSTGGYVSAHDRTQRP